MLSSLTDVLQSHSGASSLTDTGPVARNIDVSALRAAVGKIPEPRAKRGLRYPFTDLLLILICAVFSGAKSLVTVVEWAQQAAETSPLFASGKIPSPATIHRLVARLDPLVPGTTFHEWTPARVRAGNGTMASVRNLAINLHQFTGATNIAKALCTIGRNPKIARSLIGL